MQSRLSPSAALLDIHTSPKRLGPRPWWLNVCLVLPSCALLLLLFFPNVADVLHCSLSLGASPRCSSTAYGKKSALERLDRAAIHKSCVPRREGGKIVLVTGSAGFIGYWSARRLRERGDGVIGLDNFNDYYPVSLKVARDAELKKYGVHTVRGDLNDEALVRELFSMCRPTHVLHLAAQAGVRFAALKPLTYIDSNVRATTVLFEAVKRQKPMPHVVYASSSSVYGRNTHVPFSETDRVDAPASLYAATKRGCELIASVYNRISGMSVTGLRFFTVYGPWGRPDMAALAFAHQISEGKAVKIFQGPGKTELARDFTYIDDIVAGVIGALDTAAVRQERIFNLGNTHPHTVSEFVNLLEQALKKKAIRSYVDLPQLGDVLQTHSNISAARDELGFDPQVPLEEGLQRFAEWFYTYYGPEGRTLERDQATYIPMR